MSEKTDVQYEVKARVNLPHFLMFPVRFDTKQDRWIDVMVNINQISSAAPLDEDEELGVPHLKRRTRLYMTNGGHHDVQTPWEYVASALDCASKDFLDMAEEHLSDFQDEYLAEYHPTSQLAPRKLDAYEELDRDTPDAELPWYDEVRDVVGAGAQGLLTEEFCYDDEDFDDFEDR